MNIRITGLILLLCFTLTNKAQSLKEVTQTLKSINSLAQVDSLKTKHPAWDIYSNKMMNSDTSFPTAGVVSVGDIVLKQYSAGTRTYAMKVLKHENTDLCKVKYIYLSKASLSQQQIDSIREVIIARYKKGEDFETLVKTYTMDNNTTGDLDWFYEGMMVDEFDKGVRHRKKGEIFTVDVPENGWYYVVLKNENNKTEKSTIFVMIEYNE